MLGRLMSNMRFGFSIRLKGPVSQRNIDKSSIKLQEKKEESFFAEYYEQTNQLYDMGDLVIKMDLRQPNLIILVKWSSKLLALKMPLLIRYCNIEHSKLSRNIREICWITVVQPFNARSWARKSSYSWIMSPNTQRIKGPDAIWPDSSRKEGQCWTTAWEKIITDTSGFV